MAAEPVRTRLPDDPSATEWLTVTTPLLPDLADLVPLLEQIWNSRWLTNQGGMVRSLEGRLAAYLGAPAVQCTTNGTLALELAIRSLLDGGEVICPGYSFPATWNLVVDDPRFTPVFVDIDETWCVDPDAVEAAITPRTTAILAVHAYGFPCDHERLAAIAERHGLALIYDAAHAFGVTVDGVGVTTWGDASTLSFHATKVFTTVEGGAIVARDPAVRARIARRRMFGFDGPAQVELGTNGKLDELRAAVGLLNLAQVDAAIAARRRVVGLYLEALEEVALPGLGLASELFAIPGVRQAYPYFPVRVDPAHGLDRCTVDAALRAVGVLARPYFAATVVTSPLYAGLVDPGALPRTVAASAQMLCLPLHHLMTADDVARVVYALAAAYGWGAP